MVSDCFGRREPTLVSTAIERFRVYTDLDRTLQDIGSIHASECEGWRKLAEFYRRIAPKFLPLFYVECPSREMWQRILRLAEWLASRCIPAGQCRAADERWFCVQFFSDAGDERRA